MEQNKTLDVLMTAKKLLSDPRRWVKGHYRSQNEDGEACYCALGALRIAAGGGDDGTAPCETEAWNAYRHASQRVRDAANRDWVPDWNDSYRTKHEDVMRVFTDAINAELGESGSTRATIPAA